MDVSQRKFVNTEAIVLGLILGLLLIILDGGAMVRHEHVIEGAILETVWTVIYLTLVVAFVGFKLPTFFATSRPRMAVFMLVFLAGHVSLFFDSFAVVLLLVPIRFSSWDQNTCYSHNFNVFAVKVIAAFNALTVGGGFYLGELWGLPYYISSGMDNVLAGFPLLLVATPFCALTSLLAAKVFPVKMEEVKFDKEQTKATFKIVFFLAILIITHRPLLCLGVLLVFSAVTGRVLRLVKNTLHELEEGALNANGLIIAALIIKMIPGAAIWFEGVLQGGWILVAAAVSSPFAGAMTAPAPDPVAFYSNLSWIMLGAPLFVSSSLVAIVVFRNTIARQDLPGWLQPLTSRNGGVMHEALAYTALCLPMVALLGLGLWAGNATGLFPWFYQLIGG